MKKILTFLVLALICVSASARTRDLKIMTYNLRFGEIASMEEFGKYISEQAPDIVALQECDWATYRERAPKQNGVKFVNELAHSTGMFGIYGKAIDYRKGYYGVGLLSKYPIVSYERILLPNPENKEQRVMLVADIEMPDGEIVTFCCTHLEVSSSECRIEQVKFIEKQLSKKNLCFLAGDMNAQPDSPEMQYLCRKWDNLTNAELTYSTIKPSTKIDYIYSKKSMCVELKSTVVDKNSKLSDHFPVISEISFEYR